MKRFLHLIPSSTKVALALECCLNKSLLLFIISTIGLVLSLPSTHKASAATFDIADGDVPGLMSAITAGGTINLANNGVYTLTHTNNIGANGGNGLPVINSGVTINGNGAMIQRDSNSSTDEFRIFEVSQSGSLNMNMLTLANGNAGVFDGGGILSHVNSTVNINTSTIMHNRANSGGGIFAKGHFQISRSTLNGNHAIDSGGAIRLVGMSDSPEFTWITKSTISNNEAGQFGGGIYSSEGHPGSRLKLQQLTIASNTATEGAGGYFANTWTAVQVLIALNKRGTDCGGIGHRKKVDSNLDSDGSCRFQVTADPQIGALQDNGGPTKTRALHHDSPAIDRWTGCLYGGGADRADQRDQPISGDRCDIGAFEFQYTKGDLFVTMSDSIDPVNIGGLLAYNIEVGNLGIKPARAILSNRFPSNNLNFVSATPDIGKGHCTIASNGRLECNLKDIGSRQIVNVEIVAEPAAPGVVTNRVQVVGEFADPDTSNNQAREVTVISP